jgi:EmrB/QacA subfamily drug resistance transporter
VGELSHGRRLLILGICCMSLLVISLDNTIVNVALPKLHRELRAPVSGLQWTIDAYTLVLATLLLLSGSTADRLGRRRVFQTGLVVFGVGSLLCSLAPNLGALIAFRMVQAVGGSMLNPVAMSIITNVFTDPKERARAIGVWGGVVGGSLALGPVLGGVLVDGVGWRSIFWVNVPVVIAALVLTQLFVPESRAPHPRRFDPVGQLLVLVLLASITFGIIEGPNHGWSSPLILGCFGLGALSLAILLPYERRRFEPLIETRFFRSVPFSAAAAIAVCGFAALAGFLFLNTLYLQEVRHYSALKAGLFTLPMAAMSLIFAPLSGRLVATRGARPSLLVAGTLLAAGALVFTQVRADTPVGLLFAGYLVFGIGFAVLNAPITNTAVSGMPLARAGVAAAVASTSRQVGSALGIAVLGSVVASGITGPLATSFAPASHAGWWIIVGCGLAVLVLGYASTTARAQHTAARVAASFAEPQPAPGPAVPAGAR